MENPDSWNIVSPNKNKNSRKSKFIKKFIDNYSLDDGLFEFLNHNSQVLDYILKFNDLTVLQHLKNGTLELIELPETVQTYNQVKNVIEVLLTDLLPYIESIYIPGSFGTKNQKESSDVDIIITFKNNPLTKIDMENGITLHHLHKKIYQELEYKLNRKIDLVWWFLNKKESIVVENTKDELFIDNNIGDIIQGSAEIIYHNENDIIYWYQENSPVPSRIIDSIINKLKYNLGYKIGPHIVK